MTPSPTTQSPTTQNLGKRVMRSAKKWRPEYKMPHGDDSSDSEIRETPESVARYIAALAGELAKMAKRNDLDTLSTLLDMACIEADQAAKQL